MHCKAKHVSNLAPDPSILNVGDLTLLPNCPKWWTETDFNIYVGDSRGWHLPELRWISMGAKTLCYLYERSYHLVENEIDVL